MSYDNSTHITDEEWDNYCQALRNEKSNTVTGYEVMYAGKTAGPARDYDSRFNGGMLTGSAIKQAIEDGDITISDFDESRLNTNSYNLRLSDVFKKYAAPNREDGFIDISKGCKTKEIINIHGTDVSRPKKLYLRPGDFVLGSTMETVASDKYIPIITGRSSIGRYSISVHQEAGFGDIGFSGKWTLQLSTLLPVIITPGMEICQVYFITPIGRVDQLYNGKYQNSVGPQESRFYTEHR